MLNDEALGTVSHELHRKRRAAVSPVWTARAVTAIEPMISASVEKLYSKFDEASKVNKIIDLRLVYFSWATDILMKYMLDADLDLLDNDHEALLLFQSFAARSYYYPLLKQCSWLWDLALHTPRRVLRFASPSLARLMDMYKVCSASRGVFYVVSRQSTVTVFHCPIDLTESFRMSIALLKRNVGNMTVIEVAKPKH